MVDNAWQHLQVELFSSSCDAVSVITFIEIQRDFIDGNLWGRADQLILLHELHNARLEVLLSLPLFDGSGIFLGTVRCCNCRHRDNRRDRRLGKGLTLDFPFDIGMVK